MSHPQCVARRHRGGRRHAGQFLDGGALFVGQLLRAPSTSTVTSRSPVRSSPGRGTPRPFTRKVWPDGVPAGTRRVTGSSRVGTVRSSPGGLGEGDGHGQGQVAAPPAEQRRAVHVDDDIEVAARPLPVRRPPALDPDALPVLHPGGIRTLTDRFRCSTPVPRQVGQGVSTMVPRPPHWGQIWLREKRPWLSWRVPVPCTRAGDRLGSRGRPEPDRCGTGPRWSR
jgi:hypothetical protein